jgi:hypothetical protein
MGSLFKKPTINVPAPVATPPPAVEAPPVPTIDTAARSQDRGDKIRRRRGRVSTQLVPDGFGGSGAKTTLGS